MVKKMLSGTHGSEQGDMLVLLLYNPQRDNNHPMVTIKAQECCSICLGFFFFLTSVMHVVLSGCQRRTFISGIYCCCFVLF